LPYLNNDGIKIYYEIIGEGPPVILLHGFASNLEGSWKKTNCVEALKDNYQLILLDCRGHGKSDKPHGELSYGYKMAEDIIKLMEDLSIERANFFGNSMGSNITIWLLITRPDIFISAILGGYVLVLDEKQLLKEKELTKQIIDAFKAESVKQVKKPMARAFRQFAEKSDNDLLALAAVQAGYLSYELSELLVSPIEFKKSLKKINVPVMTVVGSSEIVSGDKTLVAQIIPDACHFQIQGKDHLTLARDSKFHMIVKAFLNHVN
jgi:pimeloyl-ACP methyl ester carboxylesterase